MAKDGGRSWELLSSRTTQLPTDGGGGWARARRRRLACCCVTCCARIAPSSCWHGRRGSLYVRRCLMSRSARLGSSAQHLGSARSHHALLVHGGGDFQEPGAVGANDEVARDAVLHRHVRVLLCAAAVVPSVDRQKQKHEWDSHFIPSRVDRSG